MKSALWLVLLCFFVGCDFGRSDKNRFARTPQPVQPKIFNEAALLPLATGHINQYYQDSLAEGFDISIIYFELIDKLPAGLNLDQNTGIIFGFPQTLGESRLEVKGLAKDGSVHVLTISIAIFSSNDGEIISKQTFGQGTITVVQSTEDFSWISSFDGKTYTSRYILYIPQTNYKMPLLIFHRGRGFNYDDYHQFLTKIASNGIICASISDDISFYTPSPILPIAPSTPAPSLNPEYDYGKPELGMESASAAQESILNFLLDKSFITGSNLFDKVNANLIFLSGHSRGGGATQASHARHLTTQGIICGFIYYMAFDLRYFDTEIPPGISPGHSIPDKQPRTPSLIFSAENDGDLVYPYSDEFIDRATGPTTFATIYGGVHNFLSDTHKAEGQAQITREQEQDRVVNFTIAFIKRWSGDTSLDGFLYGNEFSSSTEMGVTSWRRISPTLLVDDFQGSTTNTLLHKPKTVTGLTLIQNSIYPSLGFLNSLDLQQAILQIYNPTSKIILEVGDQDLHQYRYALARVEQKGWYGWQIDAWVSLADSSGQISSIQIAQNNGNTLGYLPPASGPFQRFTNLEISLDTFKINNPNLDLNHITQITFEFGTSPSVPEIVIDDVRFE